MPQYLRQIALSGLVAAVLTACGTAPTHNAQLSQAQLDFQSASVQSDIMALAPAEMGEAAAALKLAHLAQQREASAMEINHLAYLATQRVAIAREVARQRGAEQAVAAAGVAAALVAYHGSLAVPFFFDDHGAITQEIFGVLSVEASAASRTSYGATSPVRVAEQVAQWKQRLRVE